MSKTYSNLYPQVIAEINRRAGKEITTSGSRFSVQPGGKGGSLDSRALAEIITTIASDLADLIEPRIIIGLDITATTPPSATVNISAGTGTSNGKLWEITVDSTLDIPFDGSTYVFYISVYNNAFEISRTHDNTKCEIGKIIVPNPGTTVHIVDNKPDDGYDAWIISAKDIVYSEDQEFDDASIEKLRDVIGRVLADNLIGNIRLSENLKITNTQGSLEIDSESIKLISTDDVILAKFNRNGTFFYNDSGVEIAKFSIDEARIGNIVITQNSIESGNFVSGALGSGFKIKDSGDAEFNSVLIRGGITSSSFVKETISAIGGSLLIMDADILDEDMTALDSSILKIKGDTTFAVGDILRMKEDVSDEWLQVAAIISNTTYTVNRDKDNTYTSNNNPIWKKGTAVVNYGASSEGGIYLTSSESNSPYMSIVTHSGSPWDSLTTHLRLGNLNGFLGYSTDLYGIAIGNSNEYLKYDPTNGLLIKGSVTITGGNASVTFYQDEEPTVGVKDGDYWVDTNDDNLLYNYQSGVWINVGATGGITTFRQSGIPTATSSGDLWIDTDDNKLYRATNAGDDQITAGEWELQNAAIATGWAHSGDTTKIDGGDVYTGSITADKITTTTLSAITANLGTITAGTVTGATIQTSGAGSRVVMDVNNVIAYDNAAAEVFKVLLTGTDVGDVIIGNYASSKGIKWDKSAETFAVKGAITASSGDFTGTVNVGTAGKVYLDGANEVIKVYDASNNLLVEIGKLS